MDLKVNGTSRQDFHSSAGSLAVIRTAQQEKAIAYMNMIDRYYAT